MADSPLHKILIWSCIIPVIPVTKKNSQRLVPVRGRILVLPSKVYTQWEKACAYYVEPLARQIDYPVSCRALMYRVKDVGDASNYYNAIGDMLQKHGIVKNDKLIRDWDESRLLLDPERPRLEVELYTVGY